MSILKPEKSFQVFPNPQQVMSKFVLNIYHSKLKEHIANKLADKNKSETYLTNLFQVKSKKVDSRNPDDVVSDGLLEPL